jgi:hypothetical protein
VRTSTENDRHERQNHPMTAPVQYCSDPPDIPPGMTIDEYRQLRARPARRGGLLRRLRRSRRARDAARSLKRAA